MSISVRKKARKVICSVLALLTLFSLMSVSAFAAEEERVTRTTTLKIDSFYADMANEAEGWSWDKETTTLTLDNVNFATKDEPCLLIRTGVKIQLVGNNVFTAELSNSDTAAIDSVVLDSGLRSSPYFYGEKLTVNASNGFAVRTENVQNYGASLTFNGKVDCEGFTSWNGNTQIDATDSQEGYCIKATEWVSLSGGTVTLRPGKNAGVIVEQNEGITSNTEGFGIRENANFACIGGTSATLMGQKGRADTYIDTKGTITLSDCEAGFVQATGRVEYKAGKIVTSLESEKIFILLADYANALVVSPADYSCVREALVKVPTDLYNYKEKGVEALQAVIDSVDYELDAYAQYEVEAYAQAIEQAVNNLEMLPWIVRFFKSIVRFFNTLFI